jgi:hypothetical protein
MCLPKNDLLKKSVRGAAHFSSRAVICYLGAENMRKALLALIIVVAAAVVCFSQTETATVSGRVLDKSGATVVGAEIVLTNVDTNAQSRTKTGKEGLYVFAGVMAGRYRLAAGAAGFSVTVKNDLVVHVQDELAENFTLQVGSVNEVVTVTAQQTNINTTNASVSTVVDQSYVQNMPLNGRSFQDLILLTPGTVTQSSQTSSNANAGRGVTGEFSVNGQRPESNYYTVDGVSANLGAASNATNMLNGGGPSGSLPTGTALGTTQALVSVDELQEFRVQSSTYSAEYGRTPGGQFAFETKSGTNQWHGTAYNYLRNDAVDATDYFTNWFRAVDPTLKKTALRQNDFGGTLGGPVRIPHLFNGKDKTFFFFSYEGLRLIQPQPAGSFPVPDAALRQSTPTPLNQVLNAFPVPNGPQILQPCADPSDPQCDPSTNQEPSGAAQFIGAWSNRSSIDSTSVRFDHAITDRTRLFFRFSNTISNSKTIGGSLASGVAPSQASTASFTTRTYTGGVTSVITNHLSNDFRLNYGSNLTSGVESIAGFGGSVPVDLAQLTGLGPRSSPLVAFFLGSDFIALQQLHDSSIQRQWNLVDTVSYALGRHQLKFGADYRRLTPFAVPSTPGVDYFYFGASPVQANSTSFTETGASAAAYPLYTNFSAFVQDDWRVSRRLSLSTGLRWDVNPPPGVTRGLLPYAIQGPSPATWAAAPQGTPEWHTTWYNFAPRLGAAFVARDKQGWETVVRAGGGLFFDTAQQLGSLGFFGPGFSSLAFGGGTPFPQVPPIPAIEDPTTPAGQPYASIPFAYHSHLQLPYTLQWNASVEQALGKSQALTISYVGSHAARLLRYDDVASPTNPNSPGFKFIVNGLTSDYDSAQVQLHRRLSRGLTALASYTWSHCLDYGSQNYNFGYQRGNCEFDVRHNLSGAFSYDVPNVGRGAFLNALLHHWGIDDRLTARSAFPITLNGSTYIDQLTGKTLNAGLDLVANKPLYLYGNTCIQAFQGTLINGQGCPGGRAINADAFAQVPIDPNTFQPTRAGNAPRNFVRGFGAWQMNFAVRREFQIFENLKLQFRAEAFNIFNHSNFGSISTGDFTGFCSPKTSPGCNFGLATATLANSLGNTLSSIYQTGGPRSMQFALKLVF